MDHFAEFYRGTAIPEWAEWYLDIDCAAPLVECPAAAALRAAFGAKVTVAVTVTTEARVDAADTGDLQRQATTVLTTAHGRHRHAALETAVDTSPVPSGPPSPAHTDRSWADAPAPSGHRFVTVAFAVTEATIMVGRERVTLRPREGLAPLPHLEHGPASHEPLEVPMGPTAGLDGWVADGAPAAPVSSLREAAEHLAAVQERYAELGAVLSKEAQRVADFYRRQSSIVASASVSAVDAAKRTQLLSDRQRVAYADATREAYFSLGMLHQYCENNVLAFLKIVDQLEHAWGHTVSESARGAVAGLPFALRRVSGLHLLRVHVADAFRQGFTTTGTTAEALRALRKSTNQGYSETPGHRRARDQVQLAALAGFTGALLLASAVSFFQWPVPRPVAMNAASWWHLTITFAITFMTTCFAGCVLCWEAAGVNYVFHFHLDQANHWSGVELLRDSLQLLAAWAVCLFAYVARGTAEVHDAELHGAGEVYSLAWLFPMLTWPALATVAVLQQTVWHPEGRRRWLLPTLRRVLVTPWYRVRFSDFILAAMCVTLGTMWYELQFAWCFIPETFTADLVDVCSDQRRLRVIPALRAVPVFWRLAQCVRNYLAPIPAARTFFPHGMNAAKYVVVLLVFLADFSGRGLTRYFTKDEDERAVGLAFFFLLRATDSVFRATWDVLVDCGLGPVRIDDSSDDSEGDVVREAPQGRGGGRRLRLPCVSWRLRPRLFPAWSYVVFIVLDVLIRCQWGLRYYLATEAAWRQYWIPAVFVCTAVFRRFMWLTVRVEHEQVNNIELYKLTTAAPPPPATKHSVAAARKAFATLWDTASQSLTMRGKRWPNGAGHVDRFFSQLPPMEKLAVLRLMPRDGRGVAFAGTSGEGKTAWFAAQREEVKAHALLKRMGHRTVEEYATEHQQAPQQPQEAEH